MVRQVCQNRNTLEAANLLLLQPLTNDVVNCIENDICIIESFIELLIRQLLITLINRR